MKLFNVLIFCISIFMFSSCSKDFSETIVGTWNLADVEVLPGCNEPEIMNFEVQDGCITVADESFCITFVIMENGIAQGINTFNNESETFDLTYTLNEDTELIIMCDGSDCNNITLSGDQLRINVMEDECELVYLFEKE